MMKQSIKVQCFFVALFGILSIIILVINARLMGERGIIALVVKLMLATVFGLLLVRLCKKEELKKIKLKTTILLTVLLVAVLILSLIVNRIWSGLNKGIIVFNYSFAIVALALVVTLLTSLKPIIMRGRGHSRRKICIVLSMLLISCVCALILAREYSIEAFKEIISVFWIYAGAVLFVIQNEYLTSINIERKFIKKKKTKLTCIFFLICTAFMMVVSLVCAPGHIWLEAKESIETLLHNAVLFDKGRFSFDYQNFIEKDNPLFALLYYHGYAVAAGYLILNIMHVFAAGKCAEGSNVSNSFLCQASLYALLLRFGLSILFGLNLIPLPVHSVMSGQGLGMMFDQVMVVVICQSRLETITCMRSGSTPKRYN